MSRSPLGVSVGHKDTAHSSDFEHDEQRGIMYQEHVNWTRWEKKSNLLEIRNFLSSGDYMAMESLESK